MYAGIIAEKCECIECFWKLNVRNGSIWYDFSEVLMKCHID